MSALLFDKAVSWLPHLIYSTRLMGENGVGSRTSQGCGKFKLDSVYSGGKEIYSWKTGVLNPQTPPQALSFNQFMPEPAKTLKITLHSPLRFKSQGRFVSQLDFHLLLRSCLRRISQLERKFNRAEPTFDYANLIQRAQKIETISNKARWVDPDRYSSRQKTKMKYGGLLGEITYQGELAEFMPILRYCELVHTGKQTTFGHGQIGLEVLNS